jgi:hypothetical protein
MPYEQERICQCGGEGWDGCDPKRQELERRRALLRRTAAVLEALSEGRTLLDHPALASLLTSSRPGLEEVREPLALPAPTHWPSMTTPKPTRKEKERGLISNRRSELAIRRRYGGQYAGMPVPTWRTEREIDRIDQETIQIQVGLLGTHAVKQLERQLDHQLTADELRDIKEEYGTGTRYAQEVPAPRRP